MIGHVSGTPAASSGRCPSSDDRHVPVTAGITGQSPEVPQAERFIVTQAGELRGPPRIRRGHKTPSSSLDAGKILIDVNLVHTRLPPIPLREPVRSRMGGKQ